MKKRETRLLVVVGLVSLIAFTAGVCALSKILTDAENDGLRGPVKKVIKETYNLVDKFGTVTQELEGRAVSQYNRKGTRTEVINYDENENIKSRAVYVVSVDGIAAGGTRYNAWGAVESKWTYTYEANGVAERMIQRTYNPDGSLDSVLVYNYDAGGRMAESVIYNADGTLSARIVNSYNMQGNMVETNLYGAKGELNARITYTYNEQGYQIESSSVLYLNGVEWLPAQNRYSEYEFDAHGNWIKRVESKWVKKFGKEYWEPQRVIYRTIIYYED